MAYLLDSNILVRLANARDPGFPVALHAITELHQRGEVLHVTSQNLIEFRNVATRPIAANGLGFIPADADLRIARYESRFPILVETPAIYPVWKTIIKRSATVGKQVHDARLAAICEIYGITHLLTFNLQHFARFVATGSPFIIVDPRTI